jgi:transporter family protein
MEWFILAFSSALFYIKTIIATFAFLCVMLVIKNLEISEALPLMILTPGFVAVFAFIFIGDELTGKEVTGIALLITGTYILETAGKKDLIHPFRVILKSKNHFYVLLALIFFTASSILDRFLVTDLKLEPKAFMGFQHIFYAFNFLLIYLVRNKKFIELKNYNGSSILLWIILIAILTVAYRYTQIEAIKLAPVALVLAVKRISVFISTVVGGKIFKERNLYWKAFATVVLMAGALMLL